MLVRRTTSRRAASGVARRSSRQCLQLKESLHAAAVSTAFVADNNCPAVVRLVGDQQRHCSTCQSMDAAQR